MDNFGLTIGHNCCNYAGNQCVIKEQQLVPRGKGSRHCFPTTSQGNHIEMIAIVLTDSLGVSTSTGTLLSTVLSGVGH